MSKWVSLGVLGAVAYALFMLITVPATHAYPFAVSQFGKISIDGVGDLRLYELSGTVWEGRADVATLGNVRLEPIIWSVSAWDLLTGNVTVEFSTKSDKNKLSGTVSKSIFGGASVSNLNADIKLDTLDKSVRTYRSPFTSLIFGGKLRITDAEFAFNDVTVSSANAQIMWMEGNVKYSTGRSYKPVSLGSYKVNLADTDDGVAVKFADLGGVLKASGNGLLKPDGAYSINASLAPQPAADKDLSASMQFIGVKQADGSFAVEHSGTFAATPAADEKSNNQGG